MIKVMQLQNLANETQRNYLQSVKGLARYYQKSPDTITQEMIEDFSRHCNLGATIWPKKYLRRLKGLNLKLLRNIKNPKNSCLSGIINICQNKRK